MIIRQKYTTDILTIFSITLVLFIAGIYGLLSIHSTHVIDVLKENLDIMVEFEDNAGQTEIQNLIDELEGNEKVIEESVTLIERDQAKDLMAAEIGDEFLIEGMENPFRNSLLFRMRSEYYTDQNLNDFKDQLSARSYISNVFFHEDFFRLLTVNLRKFSYVALGLGFVLLILSMALIYNTVHLSLNADRGKIETMELVGANWNYIKKPYLKKSLIIGLCSSIIGIVLLAFCIFLMASSIPEISNLINTQSVAIVMFGILLLGLIMPTFASFMIVSAYLRKVSI